MDPIFQDPRFDALRNAIYHAERRSFLNLVNKTINFLVVMLGASVVAKGAHDFHLQQLWLEMSLVFLATLQLVFDFGDRAATHGHLQKRYYDFLSDVEGVTDPTDAQKRHWSAKLLTLAADEPLPMRALDALAYNKALDATTNDLERAKEYRLYVSWHARRLRHLIAFQSRQFVPDPNRRTFRAWLAQKMGGRKAHG
jgi:hypothetical protein